MFTRILAPAIAALTLAACGGSGDSSGGGETLEEQTAQVAQDAADSGSIGTIDATIGGESYSFIVPADRGVEVREFGGVKTLNISGLTAKGGETEMPYITLTHQDSATGMQSISLVDGSMMHQLESVGMGGVTITFDEKQEGGPYSGSFSATLTRMDPDEMPADAEVMFGNEVEIEGTFNTQ